MRHTDPNACKPTDSLCLHASATYLIRKSRFAEAIPVLDRALEAKSDVPAIYKSKAYAYLKLERYEEAVRDTNEALKLNGADLQAGNYREEALDREWGWF